MRKTMVACLAALTAAVATGDEAPALKWGFRLQGWYQAAEQGAADGGTAHDFMARRAYVWASARLAPNFSLFVHLAGDRIGQTGLDAPGVGLGSGIALRDGWIAWEPDPAFRVQLGRMYVPFTRAFGTESTFTLLGVDLPHAQGGGRGALFYASKVGRDDGVVVWGTPLAGRLQYRVGVSEGVEGASNPSDSLRLAGRVAVSLLDPETAWFNRGTYLGEKRVLAFGLGYDGQDDLGPPGTPPFDTRSWTADVFLDLPVGRGAVTAEGAYTDVEGATQALPAAGTPVGADLRLWYLQAGYLLPGRLGPGRLQLYGRSESIDPESGSETSTPAVGANYFLRGHDLKVTLDWNRIDRRGTDTRDIVTLQVQFSL
ncbi:MAG: hypothetical protein AB1625_03625 [Acidobacteriota bacterium]